MRRRQAAALCSGVLATVHSAAVLGIDAYEVAVEVDCAQGLPQFTVVGLAAGAVKESRERVTAALVNSGFAIPARRTTVNLAPADRRKEGSAFDLPMALGLLVATGQLAEESVAGLAAVGELALDGTLRPVRGVLPIARLIARERGRTLVVPPGNVREAQLVSSARLAAPNTLRALVNDLRRRQLAPPPPLPNGTPDAADAPDLSEVIGQEAAKRALEIAAAGNHGVIFVGPPGAGKTLLARCMPRLLPPLSDEESLEVIAIHSVAGLLAQEHSLAPERPFRAPHHTISAAGLIGGGSPPRPGEVSLAHRGVLFLDEMLEFPRYTLDAMRQPLEDGHVVIARAAASIRFPARFTLIGAMNPCPCGRAGDSSGLCSCTAADIVRYRARLSGPLADRIDLHVPVRAVPVRELARRDERESSTCVRARVERAQARQMARAHEAPRAAGQPRNRLHPFAALATSDARELLACAAEQIGLSARAYHRVLRVARTIADLAGEETTSAAHIAEALRFRPVSARDGDQIGAAPSSA